MHPTESPTAQPRPYQDSLRAVQRGPQSAVGKSYAPFSSQSASRRSQIATGVCNHIITSSGGQPEELVEYLAHHSHKGKELLSSTRHAEKMTRVIRRIGLMYASAPQRQRPSILALLAPEYRCHSEMAAIGIPCSRSQFRTASEKAANERFGLSGHRPHLPASRAPIDDTIKRLVIDYLHRNSRVSCSTTSARRCASSVPVYYLEKTKLAVYNQLMAEHPNLKISRSAFYKLCPRNFKKGRKRTDMCSVSCLAGRCRCA
jgi:hypothetical protein